MGAVAAASTAARDPEPKGATTDSSVVALAVDRARADYAATTGGTLDGAGLKIGILSDSFNREGGEAADIADGDLPPASQIDILKEGAGGADEGRAMAELIHQIAPGAQLYFYTATDSEADFAQGIGALAAAGVNVIVDDVTYPDEPFYQDTGAVTKAVEQAVAQRIDYFTAAGNQSDNFYEAAFDPIGMTLPGIGLKTVHDIQGGSPYEAVTLGANPVFDFTMEWTEPFGASRYDIGFGLYSFNAKSGSYTLVRNFASTRLGGDPVLDVDTTLTLKAGTYYLAFYESASDLQGGAPITPGTFKIIFADGGGATVDGIGAGLGSGAVVGHALAPGVDTIAAVNVANTPAEGQAVPTTDGFSGAGPGVTYLDAAGAARATPLVDGKPSFAATDGTPTSVFAPFDGTSAAAANAAGVGLLVLQADTRLAPVQLTYLLTQSAIPTTSAVTGGAGLIQADAAVAGAEHAAATPVWTAQGGSTLWSNGLNWSDGAAPGEGSPVQITDGLGLFTSSYTVVDDIVSDRVASLTVDGGRLTGARPNLQIASAGLATGSVTLGAGTIDIGGLFTDAGALLAGSGAGMVTVEDSGVASFAGTTTAADGIAFAGSGGELTLGATNAATLVSGLESPITNFAVNDVLDLSGLAVSSVAAVHVVGQAVTLVNASGATLAALTLSGAFTQLGFTADEGGGTELVACYVSGTRIAIPGGERPIEALQVGDFVLTASGHARRVRWAGRRGYAARFVAANPTLRPIRLRAGALPGGLPRRDLLVSPEHAMLLGGRLVPARLLVNGTTILPDPADRDVLYLHLELESHDILLAEGAPSESFIDHGSRRLFHTATEDASARPVDRDCAPRVREAGAWAFAGVQDVRIGHPGRHAVALLNGISAIRLVSPPGRAPGDARRLGAAIAAITLDGAALALDDPRLSTGWHAPEAGWRWTDGDGLLLAAGAARLELRVAAIRPETSRVPPARTRYAPPRYGSAG